MYYHRTLQVVDFKKRDKILYSTGCYKNGDKVELKTGDGLETVHELKDGTWINYEKQLKKQKWQKK